MFEKCQHAQTTDLFPPLCVAFFCRASVRLQKSALIDEKISRHWAFRHLSNKVWTEGPPVAGPSESWGYSDAFYEENRASAETGPQAETTGSALDLPRAPY